MSAATKASAEPASEGRELELKYAVADMAAVRRLVDADTLAGLDCGPWRTIDVVDQYLDTRGGALAHAGYGARLRHVGRRTLVTVKSARSRARRSTRRGLHDRLELEARATRQLDPGRWQDSPARALIEATVRGEALHTLFFINQQRAERDLTRDGTSVARLSLDHGVVRRFGRVMGEINALEVEALAADPTEARSVLESIADELDESPELRPEQRSKEELALALVGRALEDGRRERAPRKPGVAADDALAEAGRKVLRMHLLRMLGAEAAARSGDDVEGVHKMRVATRRMRAAWRVFDGAYRPRLQRRYVRELRDVAQVLGAVRDLDVQMERLALYRKSVANEAAAALEPLAAEWQRRRDVAREHLLDVLASSDYDRFINDYRAFVDTPGGGTVDGSGEALRDVAGGRVWRAYELVRAHETALPYADVPELHALRIDGKRLRYALEFVREILPATVDRLIADVTALQDHIGKLNDAHIAADTTRAWLLDEPTALSAAQKAAASGYLRAAERQVARRRRSLLPAWRRIASPAFRRRLALAVSSI